MWATVDYARTASSLSLVPPAVALGVHLLVTAFLGRVIDRSQRQVMAENPVRPRGRVVRTGSLQAPLSVQEVRGAVLRAVAEHGRAKVLRSNDRTVLIRVGLSWRSAGEFILLEMDTEAAASTHLHVASWPVLSTTLIDYGKNSANVAWLLRALPVTPQR